MAKKNVNGRKPSGAAGIAIVEDALEVDQEIDEVTQETESPATKSGRKSGKEKADQSANGNVSLGDIRKAAAFVNSVGGLEKALGLLQILKVAKEVQ